MSILDGVQRVLQLYAEGETDLSFSEVSARLSLAKSSASRLLAQMLAYGLLEQDAVTRRYRLGELVIAAVRASVPATPLDDACRDVLTRLSSATGMTAYLSTLSNTDTVVLQRLNGSNPVQVLSPPGSRRAAADTAMGRVLLSRLPHTQYAALYGSDSTAGLPAGGADCPATVGVLSERIASARDARHAVSINEAMPGIGAVAAALRHPSSGELRGLCVSFVSFQHPLDDIPRLRRLLLDEVGALGRQIGDPFWASPTSTHC